ncbi:MAG: hypothetical protein ACLU4N_08290 [Butyricimonas faecihominis]
MVNPTVSVVAGKIAIDLSQVMSTISGSSPGVPVISNRLFP